MNDTQPPALLPQRDIDELDVLVAEAMLLEALGPGTDAMLVRQGAESVTIELTPLGRATLIEMAATVDAAALDGWMGLLAPTLVEMTVAVVGEHWRAEVEVCSELLAAERADQMRTFSQMTQRGPVVVPMDVRAVQLVAHRSCDPRLLTYL